MYLDNVLANTEEMLETTMKLHQDGKIPVNSWIINLDQIAHNARNLSKTASDNGLKTYIMSKQHNRNPYINALAMKMGMGGVVAVDFQGALACRDYQIPLAHAGHLNQIPRHLIREVLQLSPEVMTVYSFKQAQWINDACEDLGIIQDILIRVYGDPDYVFIGQEGGFHLNEVPQFIDKVNKLKHISLVGATAFPCLHYNGSGDEKITPTINVQAINEALKIMKNKGIEIKQVNMPGNTSSAEMALLKELGATHVEPGNSLLGTSPNHAFHQNMAESTAVGYLSEISHFYGNTAYAYGGGCYHTNYSDQMFAFIGSNWSDAKAQGKVLYNHDIVQDIDYHMQFIPGLDQKITIGDSVVSSYRTQMHMTRSYHVAISGISGERPLKVHAILDNARNPLDKNLRPISHQFVIDDIKDVLKSYE